MGSDAAAFAARHLRMAIAFSLGMLLAAWALLSTVPARSPATAVHAAAPAAVAAAAAK